MSEQRQFIQGGKPVRKGGLEVVSKYEEQNISLSQRITHHAVGYDFEVAEEVVIPGIWKTGWEKGLETIVDTLKRDVSENKKQLKPILMPTGARVYIGGDEFLQLANRSSNPLKRFSMLTNGVDVTDSDYYNNRANEGHIIPRFINFGFKDVVVKKGECIG